MKPPFDCRFAGIEGIGECFYARHPERPECWNPGRDRCPRNADLVSIVYCDGDTPTKRVVGPD